PPPSLTQLARTSSQVIDAFVHAPARLLTRRPSSTDETEALAPKPAWHALATSEVLSQLETSKSGLGRKQAHQVLARVGPNLLAGIERRSRLQILEAQVFTLPTALLGGAMALSIALGDVLEAG